MHCLEVIIAKNAQAAGREAGHADNDWNDKLASDIHAAAIEHAPDAALPIEHYRNADGTCDHGLAYGLCPEQPKLDVNDESYLYFNTGYLRGRTEG